VFAFANVLDRQVVGCEVQKSRILAAVKSRLLARSKFG
jgi:hypothetical protein